MDNPKQIKLGKKGSLVVGILVIIGLGIVVYGQKHGLNLHINSSTGTSGQNHQITEHLDGQVDASGTIQAVYNSGKVLVVATDNVAIDLSQAYASPNAGAFIRGDVKTGAHFKAVLQKTDNINSGIIPVRPNGSQQITQFYQLMPSAPYYFEITP